MNEKRETVGKVASDLLTKVGDTRSPIEIQKATEIDFLKNLEWSINHELKLVDCTNVCKEACLSRTAPQDNFYIEVITQSHENLPNVLRNFFITKKACPTPNFDQSVWLYEYKLGKLRYLWTVPNKETALTLKENRNIVHRGEHHSLQFVLDYFDGKLHRVAKKLNKETMLAGGALESSTSNNKYADRFTK